MAFCEWLTAQAGLAVTLPTEAQWKWAARAGHDTRFFYGRGDRFLPPRQLRRPAAPVVQHGYDGPTPGSGGILIRRR